MSGYTGFQQPDTTSSDFNAHNFLINQIINRLATTTLVRVVSATNSGGVAPVGFVDVMPMVHQVNGAGEPTPHGVIHNVPYFRLQGGANAIIIDPAVGDVGLAVFCSRDISQVKRTKKAATPGSNRKFDWADALYVGGLLNGAPTQYVRCAATGVFITSPTRVTLTAPEIQLNGNITSVGSTINMTGNLNITGNVANTGALTNNGKNVGSTHTHGGVQSGGATTGVPT